MRSSSYIQQPSLTPQSFFAGDMSAFSSSTNRIVVSGFGYDTSGNVTGDPRGPNQNGATTDERQGYGVFDNSTQAFYNTRGETGDSSTAARQAFEFALADTGGRAVFGLFGRAFSSILGRGAAEGGGTTLYRAVTKAELDDIVSQGAYRTGGASVEGKYFFESAENAAGFARKMFGTFPKEGPYTITSTTCSETCIQGATRQFISGEGMSVFVPKSQLPLGPVKVWNWSPKPE